MRLASLLFGLALACTAACGNSTTGTTTIDRPELLAVDPEDFLGSLRCGTDVRSYVATLIDVTEPPDGGPPSRFALASSPPTPCTQQVTFSQVTTNHRYVAEVDGYSQAAQSVAGADDLTAIAAIAPGSRLQSDRNGVRAQRLEHQATCGGYYPSPDAGAPDAGRWQDDPPGVFAYDSITQTPHRCNPRLDGTPPDGEGGQAGASGE